MMTDVLRVLTYHRVVEPDVVTGNPSLISATPAGFGQQMRYLANHYRVVSVAEVLAALRGEQRLPTRAVLLTFDDGYRDFGEVAWPILRRYRLPATLFVVTAHPDQPERDFWWDRLARAINCSPRRQLDSPIGPLPLGSKPARHSALRTLRAFLKTIPHTQAMHLVEEFCRELGVSAGGTEKVLGWSELRQLASDGVTMGAHTQTHPALTQLPIEEARAEIRGSREDLRRELGSDPPVFAYPFGLHDARIVEDVRKQGFELAVSCRTGHNRLTSTDALRLRRTHITARTTPFILAVRLTRSGAYLDSLRLTAKRRQTNPLPSCSV